MILSHFYSTLYSSLDSTDTFKKKIKIKEEASKIKEKSVYFQAIWWAQNILKDLPKPIETDKEHAQVIEHKTKL